MQIEPVFVEDHHEKAVWSQGMVATQRSSIDAERIQDQVCQLSALYYIEPSVSQRE